MAPITNGIDSVSTCTAAALKCQRTGGIGFVGRYYSRTMTITGKRLTSAEARLITKAGLQLFSIYEDGPL